MSVKISKSNSKLGIIPSVNLPPIITCRSDAPCIKECYALKGRFRFSGVRENMASNYDLYRDNSEEYFRGIKESIDNGFISYKYFRWHASGDIVDKQYLVGMVKIANDLPRTYFLAFTKKYELVNAFIDEGGVIPENLHIIFSAWGDSWKLLNPYNFPVAFVRFKAEDANSGIPDSAIECSGNCTSCLQCWNISRGESVVFDQH